MKYLSIIVFIWLMVHGVNANAEEGKNIFDSLHCATCHKVDTGKVNPSLAAIAQAYKGKENQLLNYLKGEAEPIVNPGKGNMMKRQIEKTKALKETERKSLLDFIMGFGH